MPTPTPTEPWEPLPTPPPTPAPTDPWEIVTPQRSLCSACKESAFQRVAAGALGLSVGVTEGGYYWDLRKVAEEYREPLAAAIRALPERDAPADQHDHTDLVQLLVADVGRSAHRSYLNALANIRSAIRHPAYALRSLSLTHSAPSFEAVTAAARDAVLMALSPDPKKRRVAIERACAALCAGGSPATVLACLYDEAHADVLLTPGTAEEVGDAAL